jgi:ribonuclease HI
MTYYYAVKSGWEPGIYDVWDECFLQINDYKCFKYKRFSRLPEAIHYLYPEDINNESSFVPDYYVYTDGSCHNNGKPNASAGIGIYFGENDDRNVSKKITGKQTNNAAELKAIIDTYPIIKNDLNVGKKIMIVTDSEYAIKCIQTYGHKCFLGNWKKDIPNKELVKQVYHLYYQSPNAQFRHIKAHTKNSDIHSIGNMNADKLANMSILH